MTLIVTILLTASPCGRAAFGAGRYASPEFVEVWRPSEVQTEIPSQGEKTWNLPALPQKPGTVVALRFHAVLKMASNGCNNYLSLKLNGIPLLANVGNKPFGLPRLLNYSMKNYHSEEDSPPTNPYFADDRLCVHFTGTALRPNPDSEETGWYVIDVSDLVMSPLLGAYETNVLTMGNTAKPEYWGPGYFGPEYKEGKARVPLIIDSLEAGYLPAAEADRAPLRVRLTRRAKVISSPLILNGNGFTAVLAAGGGLLVKVGRESYFVESRFSYPNMAETKWNRLLTANRASSDGEWNLSLSLGKQGLRVEGRGKYYRFLRNVSVLKDHLLVRDTFTNLTEESLGIVFDNQVTPANMPKDLNVSGRYRKTYIPYSPENPAWNPTIFFAGEKESLGVVALDDFYRLQLSLKQEGRTGYLHNQSFGLPGGDSYTFEWALYPLHSTDYFDFINQARRDYVPSCTIEGSCAFMMYDCVLSWQREKLTDWLRHRGARIVILIGQYSAGPWLGEDSNHIYKVPNFSLDKYLSDLKKAREILKSIDSGIKCLAPFETALSPDLAPGDTTVRFPDSISIMSDGSPAGYRWPEDPEARRTYLATEAHQYIYYPTLTNSYYQWMKERLLRGLRDAEMDGNYFDLFSYAYGDHGFRWTYDRWDNRTVDMDLSTYTIKRKKADLCKLTEEARADLVKTILSYKKGNVVVVNDMGVASKIRALPIFHFNETIEDYGYATTHFSTPIVLGFTTGYAAGARFIGKEGTWWQAWETDKDFFEDVKDKLRSGCLYYTYVAPPGIFYKSNLTHPTLPSRMFPITITEIHEGWIKGKERIITLHSGRYSWRDKRPAEVYFYDNEGRECPGSLKTSRDVKGICSFDIDIPQDGAAVIEKR